MRQLKNPQQTKDSQNAQVQSRQQDLKIEGQNGHKINDAMEAEDIFQTAASRFAVMVVALRATRPNSKSVFQSEQTYADEFKHRKVKGVSIVQAAH